MSAARCPLPGETRPDGAAFSRLVGPKHFKIYSAQAALQNKRAIRNRAPEQDLAGRSEIEAQLFHFKAIFWLML